MNEKQLEQDNQYNYPYHYIPSTKNGFSQHISWSWSKQYLSAVEFILNEIKSESNSIESILDVGCGDGRITKELSSSFPSKKITGVDYSDKAINLAKALNPKGNYKCVDICTDNKIGKYEAITLIEVFEHVPTEKCVSFASALSNILIKNGLLYITVPHKNKAITDKHFQHFSFESLFNYFKYDFECVQIKYIQKHDKILTLLNYLFSNKYWLISNKLLNNIFYNYYKKKYFHANESNCGRIFLKLRKS